MSLVSQALIFTASKVISGMTLAGADILRQPVDPIAEVMQLAQRAPAPVISIYAERVFAEIEGRATQGKNSEVSLKFFTYIAPGKQVVTLENGQEVVQFTLDQTSAGLTLDLVARQIFAALHTRNDAWGALFRRLAYKFQSREERYILVEIENGVKIPASEVTLIVDAIPEPEFGVPIDQSPAMAEFCSALGDSGEEGILASVFRAVIEQPSNLQAFAALKNSFALTQAGLEATGVAPYQGVTTDAGAVPPLNEVIINSENGPIEP